MKGLTKCGLQLICVVFMLSELVLGCTAYKILLVPLFGKSHIFCMTSIGEELGNRGHLVHMLLPAGFPLSQDLASNQSKITVIRFGSTDASLKLTDFEAAADDLVMQAMESGQDIMKFMKNVINEVNELLISLLLGNEQLYEDLTNFHYDMSIVDAIFFAKQLTLIPHRLGIPYIVFSDALDPWRVPTPWLPSFTVNKIAPYVGPMKFRQRIWNTVSTVLFYFMATAPNPPHQIMEKYQSFGSFESLDELISKAKLFVTTSDPILNEPLPTTPNVVLAGGLTIKPIIKSKPFPNGFEDFMKDAKSGIIVVSFGSMAHKLPKHIANKLIDAFSQIPDFHFIWRFTNKDNLDLPKNVMIEKWLPQNDLLADPRVKLFITHCGNNGQFEAVYHGVPMIGFPLFGDQPHNGKRMEYKGYGIAMNIHDFSARGLLKAIHQVVSNEKYKKRVTLASEILKSARRGPAERAGDAVEHVIRFGGDHLRPAGSDLALYQYLMFDILAFLLVVVTGVVFLIWKITLLLIRKFGILSSEKSNKRKVKKSD